MNYIEKKIKNKFVKLKINIVPNLKNVTKIIPLPFAPVENFGGNRGAP